jgi:sugar phosphate isomerase/epimerase
MLLRQLNDAQLTYCTNVHPGETLPAVREMLKRHVTAVKAAVAPHERFGVGLRLAAAAADSLAEPGELARFKAELEADGLYCFTINGFPYGSFHAARVKEQVYAPDWQTAERVRYTQVLGRALGELLPLGVAGSISTVPGCFKPHATTEDDERRMATGMLDVVAVLADIARSSGKHIALALEPEPECFLETTAEAVRFFERRLFSREARERLASATGVDPAEAERLIRRHLGVCLDTCHASVEFESPLEAWRTLRAAGIAVPKVQISAGLRIPRATPDHVRALHAFADGVYLHQTVVRQGDQLTRYLDLPEALAASAAVGGEWRVHFHVPIFLQELGLFESTQADLVPLLGELATVADCPHLEVETYTWDVLPEQFRSVPIESAIARELGFVQDSLKNALAAAGHA